ncbi:rhomboid family intramembrane serine protease [Cellulomonas sp. NPDC089187]|uniref:rhomboid family intramembrane serine protease n=1 Tax=Cellulomonas sp. NPDC089187 TaxID=3154970 RepID=UPI0034327104
MRESAARTPSNRTIFGGVARQGRPVVTLTLIGLCVVSYVLQQVTDTWTRDWLFAPVIGWNEPWRFLTSAFLHAPSQPFHLLFNMVALWSVGPFLEQALGRWRFAVLYLLSALGGSVMFMALGALHFPNDWVTGLYGASGAVFGLFGAVLVVLRRVGRSAGTIVGVIVINAVLGFVLPGVAWQAHLGGLVVGAVLGAIFAYAPREKQQLTAVISSVAMALVLIAVPVALYAHFGFIG